MRVGCFCYTANVVWPCPFSSNVLSSLSLFITQCTRTRQMHYLRPTSISYAQCNKTTEAFFCVTKPKAVHMKVFFQNMHASPQPSSFLRLPGLINFPSNALFIKSNYCGIDSERIRLLLTTYALQRRE